MPRFARKSPVLGALYYGAWWAAASLIILAITGNLGVLIP